MRAQRHLLGAALAAALLAPAGAAAAPQLVPVAEPCRLTVGARIAGVARFRGATRSLAAGQTAQLRLRLSRRGAARVRRALRRHRRLVARVELAARDRAGNTARNQRRVRVGA